MIREYLVVARYLAKTPSGKDPEDSIYKELERDLKRIFTFDLQKEIREMFTVIQGQEISEEEYNNE